MTRKVLLDTDIGSDIDDAVCLAYLLAHPACELLGITTVSGEAAKRAQMASTMCMVAEKNIPIHAGAETPLLGPSLQPNAPQAGRLNNWPHKTQFGSNEAVQFLRETIHAHPGEVTLLAIGPMTNIGLLFATDPEIPGLLDSLVLMCGSFFGSSGSLCEWNAQCDPIATSIVYQATVKVHRSIGLDVTMKVQLDADEVRRRFKTKLLEPVLDFASVWFEHAKQITFHDPLAAATIFEPQMCRFQSGSADVETISRITPGLTRWTHSADGRHEVAYEVTPERFFEHYFEVVS